MSGRLVQRNTLSKRPARLARVQVVVDICAKMNMNIVWRSYDS